MPRRLPELSRAEWLVMNLCWRLGRSTARQVYEKAPEHRTWRYQTVKTMLDRLTAKGYLRREKLGPLCLYEPLVPQEGVIGRSIDLFCSTVLGNTLAPFFAHLTQHAKLSREELESLKRLVQEHEGKKK